VGIRAALNLLVTGVRFSVSRSRARLCPQERSIGARSNVRLANQTRCGSATSMSRTFSMSAPAMSHYRRYLSPACRAVFQGGAKKRLRRFRR
jgi:hypothetical protein